ncbi:MAG: DUF3592 domain-containing protein, partial [Terriglobales bacterium]
RSSIRLFRLVKSSDWPVERGTVTGSTSESSYGGSVSEITYTYIHAGEYYSGIHQQPFLSPTSAQHYAAKFQPGSMIAVRINPKAPEASFVANQDQGS